MRASGVVLNQGVCGLAGTFFRGRSSQLVDFFNKNRLFERVAGAICPELEPIRRIAEEISKFVNRSICD
jgi:hypothetical protein